MIKATIIAGMVSVLLVGGVAADERCGDPVSQWQSQDTLRQMMESNGWKVRRIKVDDGCYKVHGIDPKGNRYEAKFFPATLNMRSLEIEFNAASKSGMELLQQLYQP